MASVNQRAAAIKAEVLNDLASRFLINLSNEEKKDPIKLCSYIELAHWYYLDLMRPEDPSLPGCNLKEFMRTLFQHCPWLLRDSTTKDLDKLIAEWKTHKFKKPVRGAIILNQNSTKCLLVQGFSTSWGFPKGKLEEGEADIDAAVREVYEEIGFDIRQLIEKSHYLDASVKDSDARMYIIPGVAEDTPFEPKTRNEIKNIRWFALKDLPTYKNDRGATGKSPNNFFMIIPFIGQLRRWLSNHKKSRTKGISANFQPVQSHSQTRDLKQVPSHSQTRTQAESVLRSHSSPRQEGTRNVAMVTVSRSITTPLLPTPPRRAHATQPLSPPSLLPLPHSYQSTPPLLPHPYQSSPPGSYPYQSLPSGHAHHPALPTTSLPAPLQHLSSHSPSLLPHPQAVYPQHLSYNNTAAHQGVWRVQSPSGLALQASDHYQPLLPTPGVTGHQPTPGVTGHQPTSGVIGHSQPTPGVIGHGQPTPGVTGHQQTHHPIPRKHKQGDKGAEVISLTPTKHWTNFKFDREAIMNSYRHVPVK